MKSPEEILKTSFKSFLKDNPDTFVTMDLVKSMLEISESNSLSDPDTFSRRNKLIHSAIKELANKNVKD